LSFYDWGWGAQIQVLGQSSCILIGFNKSLVALNYVTHAEVFRKEFWSPFDEYVIREPSELIVVICMSDAYVLDYTGKVVNEAGFPGVITNWEIFGDRLYVEIDHEMKSGLFLGRER
jgi:hypothetical protein